MDVNEIFENINKPKWPFKDMKVGEVIEFPADIAEKAAIRASGYGANYGMKFQRRKDKSTGKMYIKRIA